MSSFIVSHIKMKFQNKELESKPIQKEKKKIKIERKLLFVWFYCYF